MPDRARSVHRRPGEVVPVEPYLARIRADQPGDQVEGRGLPRPVGSQQPDDLALLDLDR